MEGLETSNQARHRGELPRSWPLALALSLAGHACLFSGSLLWPMARTSTPTKATMVPGGVIRLLPGQDPFRADDGPGETGATLAFPALDQLRTDVTPYFVTSTGGPGGRPGFGGGNTAGPAKFFDIPLQGQRLVFVLDASASMGQHAAWTTASRELLAGLRALPEAARFQVIVYNTVARPLVPGPAAWHAPTAANLAAIEQALVDLLPEGGTRHGPALDLALALHPDVICFLTDADDLRPADVERAHQINQGRSVIHTIELTGRHRGQPEMPLQQLARLNRGSYRAVDGK